MRAPKTNEIELKIKLAALVKVAKTQAAFWDAMSELESLTGTDLDGTGNYTWIENPTAEDLAEILAAFKER